MIKAVIFDCFGVLTTDSWRAFLDTLPPEIDKQAARDANKAFDAGLIDRQSFLQQIFDITGTAPDLLETRLDTDVSKNYPLLDYIRELKQHYKLGIVSNIASPWITDIFLNQEEQALFDEMVLSFKEGITKPDLRIFQLACSRLGVEPHEAVMVDDIPSYCAAAEEAGLKAIAYKDVAQLRTELTKILS